MTNNFDWQTEEDSKWQDAESLPAGSRNRRRWLLPLLILVALFLAAGTVFWQVRERMALAEAARTDDILSSYTLIRQAAEENDQELFRNLLSGSDMAWARAQQELFSRGWLLDLSAFGLGGQPAEVRDVEVALSPGFESGEVSAVAVYELAGQEAISSTVQLRLTSVFRQGNRWVWAPPRDEFWGGSASAEGSYLAVSYPVRDEQIVLRLLRELDALVSQMCESVAEMTCPPGLHIQIAFSREPAALLEVAEGYDSQGYYGTRLAGAGRFRVTLPAPSLLGIPLDEASYQALFRGYASHLAVGLSQGLIDADCCGSEARYRAGIQVMLRDLGLQPWPVGTTAMAVAPEDGLSENEIALLCSDGFGPEQRLLQLDVVSGEWRETPLSFDLVAVKAMPGGDGILLLGHLPEGDGVRTQVWRHSPDGEQLLLDMRTEDFEAAGVEWELQERQERLVVNFPNVYRGSNRYFTIDLRRCQEGECPAPGQSMASRPVWSPDGEQFLMREYGLLWRSQGASTIPLTDGTAPFWLDDQRYGFVRTIGREQAVVVMGGNGNENERVALTTADLRAALDAEERPPRLLIGRILASQEPASRWLILAFEMDRGRGLGQARFFSFATQTGQVTPLFHEGWLLSFNMSPSGRWLASGGFDDEQGQWVMTVTGQETPEPFSVRLQAGGSAEAIPSYAWSADEAWLLVLEQGQLTLLNPATSSLHQLSPPEPGCVQAAWYGATRAGG